MNTTHYDLIVVGGGFAGSAAAIAAARQGVKVLLAEKGNALSGAPSNNLVLPFMKHHTMCNGKKNYLSRGIFAEIKERMGDRCLNDFLFDEERLKLVLNRMAIEAGVSLLFGVYLTGTDCENGRLNAVTFASVGGPVRLTADFFIDATGDGTLSALAGCDFQLGRKEDGLCQPMTLCFRAAGVDFDLFREDIPKINPLYREWQSMGKIKNPRENVLKFYTLMPGTIHFNTTRVIKRNPTDPFDKTLAELEAREQVYEVFEFLKQNFPSFRKAQISSTALEIGVRESRMITGDHVLDQEDLISCKKFADAIAAGNYDIDIHNPEGSGTSHHYFEEGTWYTIPYRCLHPIGMENLLTAGRCISATHEAQASVRIMPIVCCTGEAAGLAAAIAKETGCSAGGVDVALLQKKITESGGFTGLL